MKEIVKQRNMKVDRLLIICNVVCSEEFVQPYSNENYISKLLYRPFISLLSLYPSYLIRP